MGSQCCTPSKNESQIILHPTKQKIVKQDEDMKQEINLDDSHALQWNRHYKKQIAKIKPSKQAFIGEFQPSIIINQHSEQSICSFDDLEYIQISDMQRISTIQERDTPIFDNQRKNVQIIQKQRSVSDDEQRKKKSKYDSRTMNGELKLQKQHIARQLSQNKFQYPSTTCMENYCPTVSRQQICVSYNIIPILKSSRRRRSKSMTPTTKRVRFVDTLKQCRFTINQKR